VPLVTRRGDYNSVEHLLVGIGSEMASSGLGLGKHEVCHWVLMGLTIARQEEYFRSHTLLQNNDSD
jgi:hypothetical protein